MWATVAVTAALSSPAAATAAVTHSVLTVQGVKVDRYAWTDSNGRPRTVSLKQEGAGNPGHGGYAVQMTYQALVDGVWQLRVVNAPEGFGYFVSHEVHRTFTDDSQGT